MQLTLSPQFGLPAQPETSLAVNGDVITIDGIAYDLSAVPEGGEGWPEEGTPFLGPITRQGGVVHCMLIARLDRTARPEQAGPWVIKAASGLVEIPAIRVEQEDTE